METEERYLSKVESALFARDILTKASIVMKYSLKKIPVQFIDEPTMALMMLPTQIEIMEFDKTNK